ncbi:MAG TPA: carboxypeptidase-like regulatory domain-containing protein [Gemmatimonadaceae bacterium]|nr:carboxypeptidase-like regulatory domain-containing protein [Gemmatimonadaceae bacterium]
MLAIATPGVLGAQGGAPGGASARGATIRGAVLQADSATPAPGVVVALVDSAGAEIARTLTDGGGAFSMRTAAGRFGLRALKVGYRPTSVPPFDVAAGDVREVRIVLGAQTVRLDAVRVEGESTCRIRDDSARLVATLWEQARGVLAASTLVSGADYRSVLVRYRNLVPVASRRVIDETVSVVQAAGPNGFISLSADSLATQGFIVTVGKRSEFRAPDANVLLSASFAAGHCFRIVPAPRGHADWLGVAFRPVADRRGFADIRGTFWLDRATSQLRKLEYTYMNVPATMRQDDAEGWVTFAQLSTGDWIVSQWEIHTPVTDPGSRRMPGMPDTLIGMAASGGITRSVMHDSTVLYANYRGAVTFHLVEADSLNRTALSRGAVAATDRAGYADAAGALTFTNLPPGRYTFRFRTPLMEWIGAPPSEVRYDVTDTTDAHETVKMPSRSDLLYPTCGLSQVAYGYVVGDSGQGVPFAQVDIEETRMEEVQVGISRIRRPEPARRIVHADQHGRWHTCVEPGYVTLAARVGGAVGFKHERLVPAGGGFIRVDLVAPDDRQP